MLKFYTYEEWIKRHPEILEAQEETTKDCDTCDGTGTIECSECGQDTECPDCDGDGEIREVDAKAEYNRQLAMDKSLLKDYMKTVKSV